MRGGILLSILELEAVGIEFDVTKGLGKVIDNKITYNIKLPKSSNIVLEDGTKINMNYSELKNYAKKKLAAGITDTYATSAVPFDSICLKTKVTAISWTQDRYDNYMKERRDELNIA